LPRHFIYEISNNNDTLKEMSRVTVETFKAIRKLAGQTQEEYSRTIGISRSLVAHIEKGTKVISKATVQKVRQAFGEEHIDRVREFTEGTKSSK
jgi:transcriptional regulator with XRE-family HTH domain